MADRPLNDTGETVIINGNDPYELTINSDGSINTRNLTTSPNNVAIQLVYETTNSSAVNANEWQDALSYDVPTNYDLSTSNFQAISAAAGDTFRAIFKLSLGTYNTNTNTFTDGSAYTVPQFASKMYVYVTTAISSAANDVVTITYTNHVGTTGRTATVTIPKSSLIGTRIEVPLQTGDIGVRDVTAISHTQTQTGVFTVEGVYAIFFLTTSVASQQYDITASFNSITIAQNSTVVLQYKTGNTAAKTRRVSLIGSLVPR